MKSPNNPNVIAASAIKGCSVINRSSDTIGSIEDLMIDCETGHVLYAVLSVDTGFLNLNSKYFAIPLEEFDLRPEQREATLNVDKERLEKAPGLEKDRMPSKPQNQFVSEVYAYYGRKSQYSGSSERENRQDAGNPGLAGADSLRSTSDGMRRESVSDSQHVESANPNKDLF